MSSAHLLVRLGDVVAALPAGAVRRVVPTPRLHPLPGAGDGLLGLAEFAGEPLAVLDLARLLGLVESLGAAPAVTVVAWAGAPGDRELLGLAVDEALEVAEIDPRATAAGGEVLLRQGAARNGAVRLVDLQTLGEEGG